MTDLLLVPLLLQTVLPVVALVWLAFGRASGRVAWILTVVAVGCLLLVVSLAGIWLILPGFIPVAYGVLFLAALVISWRRMARRQPPGRRAGAIASLMLRGMLLLKSGAALVQVLRGYRAPANVVDLDFPLRGGIYLVANGGSVELLNAHRATLAGERFLPYRGQSYGVDLVRVNAIGVRARGILPADPARYAIFGDTVYAPCGGTVVAAVDGLADATPPLPDREHMAGNHVILDCGGPWIVLAHLQRESVRVRAGDRVSVGMPLGRVGNSGNTAEPHLHVHAQRPGTAAAPFGGEPLPLRFDGDYLVRNQRVVRR